MDDQIRTTVEDLGKSLSAPATVGIGSFVFAEKNVSSSLSSYLIEKFSSAVRSNHRMILVERDKLDQIMEENNLVLSGLVDTKTSVQIGKIKGLHYLISGKFFSSGTDIKLFVELLDFETSARVADSEIDFSKSLLPEGVSVYPDNYQDALYVMNELSDSSHASDSDFVVKAWTKRGDGGVYHNGEKLVVNFYSNRDCYLKIYHIDVEGKMQLIFPNQYYTDNFIKAKNIYKIPDNRYPFSFELGPPYGTEFVKLIASTVQFSDIENAFSPIGQVSEHLITRGLNVKAKNMQSTELLISYTIVK